MTEASNKNANNLRELQLVELEILKEVVRICNENNITYYISGGTFLGAVRNKGFIPWDDDVDIAMPRTDYEKFLKIFDKKNENEDIKLSTFYNSAESKYYPAKVICENYKIKSKSSKNEQIWSSWIDIFPLDGMPKNHMISKIHQVVLLYYRARLKFSCFDDVVDINNTKTRPLHERILIWIGLHSNIGKNTPSIKYLIKIDKALKKYSEEESEVYVNFMGSYKFKSIISKSDVYKNGALYEFEGMWLNGPKEFDKYLTQIYGKNYMIPPKTSDRNKHHTEVIKYE